MSHTINMIRRSAIIVFWDCETLVDEKKQIEERAIRLNKAIEEFKPKPYVEEYEKPIKPWSKDERYKFKRHK